ncbi:hypothetical protein CHU98_g5910 [Xylaria longipes]|nr:hypothetical protein CHU98_g5910 [Xylaria longipes]
MSNRFGGSYRNGAYSRQEDGYDASPAPPRRDVARSRRSWARYWKFRIPEYSHPVSRFENGRWTVQV